MLWSYLKISLSVIIPIAVGGYARQLRHQQDVRAVWFVVQQSADLQWELTHPQESLQRNQAEAKYIRRLVADLDD